MKRRLYGALGPIIGIAVGCSLSTLDTSEVELYAAGADGSGQLIINPSPIIISGLQGSASFAPYTISFNGGGSGSGSGSSSLMSMNIGSSTFTSNDPDCTGGALCNFVNEPLPTTMAVLRCTPSGSPVTSMMTVMATTGQMTTAEVQCGAGSGSGSGGFSVQENVGRFFTPVAAPFPSSLVVTSTDLINPQQITLTPGGTFAADWSFAQCVSQSCTLGAAGQLTIPFSFTPPLHGERDAEVVVSSSATGSSPQSVNLLGTGEGAVLRIDQPMTPPLSHDFGTIAKGQIAPFSIAMTNLGNVNSTVDLQAALTAPFATTSTLPVTVGGNNGMATLDVTCSSPTALPQQMTTVMLVPSANTYQTNPSPPLAIQLRCTVADTTLQVTPTPLDFGERRVGDPMGTIPITIANPPVPAGNINITRIALVNAPNAVQLTAPPPQMLGDNMSIMATLTLATGAEVVAADLATTALEIDVLEGSSTETLVLPISGRVGRPDAVVIPSTLDLGTACIDSTVEGEVRMTNTGTATLKVQPPTMEDGTLVPLFTNPSEYPPGGASLLPGDNAFVGVRPETNNTAGRISSTLNWSVDVPRDFAIPISVELLDQGTAASPARLVYGSVSIIDPPLNQQTITLENCGPGTAFVQYDTVNATAGRANAWRLDPPEQARELFPEETMRVRVSFQPREPGRHEATLPIDIGGGMTRNIALEGDATGALAERTSFYACDCSGSTGPGRWTSWLIPLACLLVLRRRRRTVC